MVSRETYLGKIGHVGSRSVGQRRKESACEISRTAGYVRIEKSPLVVNHIGITPDHSRSIGLRRNHLRIPICRIAAISSHIDPLRGIERVGRSEVGCAGGILSGNKKRPIPAERRDGASVQRSSGCGNRGGSVGGRIDPGIGIAGWKKITPSHAYLEQILKPSIGREAADCRNGNRIRRGQINNVCRAPGNIGGDSSSRGDLLLKIADNRGNRTLDEDIFRSLSRTRFGDLLLDRALREECQKQQQDKHDRS